MLQTVYKKNAGMVKRKIAEELILVPVGNIGGVENSATKQKRIFSLNGVGEYVYDCIDGVLTLEQILTGVLEKFSVSREQAETDVLVFIDSLLQQNIISKKT